jgi:hypothetical protein
MPGFVEQEAIWLMMGTLEFGFFISKQLSSLFWDRSQHL